MNLIDTHAHLYYDRFKEDLDQVIQNALDNNLEAIINIGADLESSQKAVNFTSNKITTYSSVGLHPHEASKISTPESIHKYIEELEKLYQSNTEKVIGIGECGLDYFFEGNFDFSPSPLSKENLASTQKELFKAQISLAKELDLPLIIHCRPSASSGFKDAWQDIFLPELEGARGVFHSFTGSAEQAQKALDWGFHLGFSCIVTYPKNDHLRQIIKNMPLDKILTETDAPFLPPQTMRGQRNEPANVVEVVKIIAEMRNISFDQAATQTSKNALKLFSLV